VDPFCTVPEASMGQGTLPVLLLEPCMITSQLGIDDTGFFPRRLDKGQSLKSMKQRKFLVGFTSDIEAEALK
jgi:hypothetical protein